MSVLPLTGGVKRALAGMPFIISVAHGPGRIAFSRDATGELVVLPLHPGMELDVREHAFLLCSHTIDYSFVRIKGLRNILFGGQGMFMDRFVAQQTQGLLLLHGYGNVFERRLKPGESILVEPGAFLYKDSAVTMEVEIDQADQRLLRRHQHEPGPHDRPRPRRHPVHVRPPPHGVEGETAMTNLDPGSPLAAASSAGRSYTCPWCGLASDGAALSCPACGAAVDVKAVVSKSGWSELPGRRDMAKLQFGQSYCQIEGHLRAGGRHEPGRRRLASTSPTTSCSGRTPRSRSAPCRSRAAGSGCSPACR